MSSTLVSFLRGVNLGPHHRIKMDALRAVYESLGLREVRTLLQSGNVVFAAEKRDVGRLARGLEDAIEKKFGFRAPVILRTGDELAAVVARNPFAKRRGIDGSRLLVTFLASVPTAEACKKVAGLEAAPEEIHIVGREVYIYYPDGLARPRIPWATVEKLLASGGTGRNWNTVTKLLELMQI